MSIEQMIYIDCKESGISGDLFLTAIAHLNNDISILDRLINEIQKQFEKVTIKSVLFEEIQRNGPVYPKKMIIKLENDKIHHYKIQEMVKKVESIGSDMNLSSQAVDFAKNVLNIIAFAESEVHNTPMDKVHLHEIGSVDTIIDICGAALFLDLLGVFQRVHEGKLTVLCSRIPLGGGTVKIQHGVVSVPAPATKKIIEKYNIPTFNGPVEKELCTPTGAAIIAGLVQSCKLRFKDNLPDIAIEKISKSTGNLKFDNFPNILSIYLGNVFHEDR